MIFIIKSEGTEVLHGLLQHFLSCRSNFRRQKIENTQAKELFRGFIELGRKDMIGIEDNALGRNNKSYIRKCMN